MKTITLRISDDGHRQMKHAALDEGLSLQDYILTGAFLKGSTPPESQALSPAQEQVERAKRNSPFNEPEIPEAFKSPREQASEAMFGERAGSIVRGTEIKPLLKKEKKK